jgi:hypothetical protein
VNDDAQNSVFDPAQCGHLERAAALVTDAWVGSTRDRPWPE